MLEALKPQTQKTYLSALRDFEAFACASRLQLNTRREVDAAAFQYILCHTKSRGENLVAALYKCYPPLRGHLVWTAARLKVLAVSAPPVHHLPMDWLVALAIAYFAVRRGVPRHGALLLLQWLFGLRPSEALNLRGDDLVVADCSLRSARLSFIRVGALRGTKAGRPQIVRARPGDRAANFVLALLARRTPADTFLSSLRTLPQLQAVIARGLSDAAINLRFTPHCPRAGWATYRHTSGQSFTSLREDGRWRSDDSLRVYLDVVANTNTLESPDIRRQLPFLQHLDVTLEQWLVV